nr:hypothetical protein [Tanacetum cinerariifolium]
MDTDIFAFIYTSNPTKVKVVKRERKEDVPRLLETTFGHTVPLLPVAPDRGESELDASVDKLFDEGGSGAQMEQGDSAGGGGELLKKRKHIIADVGGPSYPPKKLREDHGTPSGASVGGKSRSVVQRLFVGAVQNGKVRGEPNPTMPFVTSSVSATPEREGEGHTDSVTGCNIRTISAPQRFVISLDSSYHSSANIAKAGVDSFARPFVPVITTATTITSTADPAMVVKEKIIEPSLFAAKSTSAGRTDPAMAGLTDLTGSDFLWNVTNGSRLDDCGVCREMVDEFATPMFFASIRKMEHDQLFIEFNVRDARQMSLSAKVRMHVEYNIREKRRLKSVVEEEAAKVIRLRTKTTKHKTMEKSLRDEFNAFNERNTILEKDRNALDVKVTDLEAIVLKDVNDKFDKLYIDFVEMTLHLEERFYPNLLTTIVGRKWLLTHGIELAVAKCLNSFEYLSALGTAVSKAIEKGMQDGLTARITHGKEGRGLTDVAAHNISAEDVFIPLAEPFSTAAVTGTEGTSDTVPATADTTAALSVTFASANIVDPISIDDYKVIGTDDQPAAMENVADANVNPFPNVDDTELNIP